MRFHSDGPAIPDILLERCNAGRVVFLCGVGISVPSGMQDFIDLTKHVIDFFDPRVNSETEPSLTSDFRYLHLMDLVERS